MPQRKHAFTLVELLVVIGIIALLISILLPALGRARESANNLKCKANMRSIGQAFVLYTGMYRGYLPATQMSGQSYSVADVTVTNRSIFWFERLMAEKLLAMPSLTGSQSSVIICPSQTEPFLVTAWSGPAVPADDPRRNRFRISYGINNWMSIDDAKQNPPDGVDDSIGPGKTIISGTAAWPKIWAMHGSSEKVLLADNKRDFQLYHPRPNTDKGLGGFNEIDWHRHGGKARLGRANFLFGDGHVAEFNQGVDTPGQFNDLCGVESSNGPEVVKKGNRQWIAGIR